MTSSDLPPTIMHMAGQAAASHLPPELLVQIFSYIPYERATVQFRQKSEPRSFKSQLAVAHVCRLWRTIALASEYWPGARLPIQDAKRVKEGLAHANGAALLYVHIDMDRLDFPKHSIEEEEKGLVLSALNQLPRIRTLFLKIDPDDDYCLIHETFPDESDAWEYGHVLGSQPPPELQDLSLSWLGDEHFELDFIEEPFPRLRYLSLMGCNTWHNQTIFQVDNLVQANFWSVYLFMTVDELVATFSRWKRLQYLSISNCYLIGGEESPTQHEGRAAYLPALKEMRFFQDAKNVGTFLTYVAFPPTTKVDMCFNISSFTPELSRTIGDAIHDHFDSPEGRSIIASAHSFLICYPNGYEVQPKAPEATRYWMTGVVNDGKPDPHFSFHQNGTQAPFLEENLARFPALETVARLDLSLKDHFRPGPPPIHLLRRFSGATCLVINQSCQSVLDDIPRDAKLFPKLEQVVLFDYDLYHASRLEPLRNALEAVRSARPSLSRLVLRECEIADEGFENIFGEGEVVIESRRNHGDDRNEDSEDDGSDYY